MIKKDDICIWSPHEMIYSYGDGSSDAYYILEGNSEIFDKDGLRLGRIGSSEIFGETSLMLNTKRTVTAVAGAAGLKARKIPKNYILRLAKKEPIIFALWEKTQRRLIDSNLQSAELASELTLITAQLEKDITNIFDLNDESKELEINIKQIRQKLDVLSSVLEQGKTKIKE